MKRRTSTDLTLIIDKLQRLYDRHSDLEDFLTSVLDLLRELTGAESTSVYLSEVDGGDLVLRGASGRDGAMPERIARGQGVAGSAFLELRSIRSSGADHEGFRSELAVPVRRGPVRIGVVVLKHGKKDYFDERAERAVRAVCSQLGATLENTTYFAPGRKEPHVDGTGGGRIIYGQTASRGAVEGAALQWEAAFSDKTGRPPKSDEREGVERFDDALQSTRRQLEKIHSDSESALYDVVSLIFGAHLLMLSDESFTGEMRRLVVDGMAPEAAVRQIVSQFADLLAAMPDARMAEKAQDVRDLGYRLIRNLGTPNSIEIDYRGTIVIAHSVYPSELVTLVAQNVGGVIFSGTGVTAHIAILARSLSVPVLITQDQSVFTIPEGTPLLLDATGGALHVQPTEQTSESFQDVIARSRSSQLDRTPGSRETSSVDAARAPAASAAAGPVTILANVNISNDARLAKDNNAQGIGLYRSEFPFIIRNDFLTEEEQYFIYRRIIGPMRGREITLRTADIGGDKLFETDKAREINPFLGVRGIRFSLANREMFRDQLRAMLRAGVGEDLRIMFPMVSSVEEIGEGREEIERCLDALQREGIEHNPKPRIGAMIELPSAVEAIEDFAAATDFLSIGTNDLVMYLLAVDRTNERLSELYRTYHPIVLRVLKRVVDGIGTARQELSICGDSAADPHMFPFYLGIGITKYSVQPAEIPRLRQRVASTDPERASQVSTDMLGIRKIREMEEYLKQLPAG